MNLIYFLLPFIVMVAMVVDLMDWLVLHRRSPYPLRPDADISWRSLRGLALVAALVTAPLGVLGVIEPAAFGVVLTAYACATVAASVRQRHDVQGDETRWDGSAGP